MLISVTMETGGYPATILVLKGGLSLLLWKQVVERDFPSAPPWCPPPPQGS